MEFEEYLESKKIDSALFKKRQPELWEDFKSLFLQVHPKSFTSQKLYLINDIRRQHPLKQNDTGVVSKVQKQVAKPITRSAKPKISSKPTIKPKIKGDKPVVKPKMSGSKPVVKSNVEAKKPVVKPKVTGKPIVQSKPTSDQDKKPVVKPKVPTKSIIKRPNKD